MLLGGLTVARCNIVTVNMTMASGERKTQHHFGLPLFFNMSKQFLAPGGLSAEGVKISVM